MAENLFMDRNYHSLTTQFNSIQAKVENYSVIVTTSEKHQLLDNQSIKFNLFPSLNETIYYYEYLRNEIKSKMI